MSTTMLLCKQCNFENEPERVYCHNCGAKLDRSLLPPEASKREDPVVVQERVRKLIKPRGVSAWQRVKNLLASVIFGALLAAIICISRAPDGVPEISKEAAMDAPPISDDMEAAQQQSGSHSLKYNENQVNAFLLASLKSKESSDTVKFERAYVHFDEGLCRITTQESIFGFSLYATTVRTVAVQNGTVVSQPVGGSFGRMALPGKGMQRLETIFAPLWRALDQDRKLVSQMQSITFHKGMVEMVTRPTPITPR